MPGVHAMETRSLITCCAKCNCSTELREITIEFERKGIRATMRGIPAMVCPQCGEEHVPGEIAGDVIDTVSKAIDDTEALLKRSDQQRRELAPAQGQWSPEQLELTLVG